MRHLKGTVLSALAVGAMLAGTVLVPVPAAAYQQHQVFFQNTQYELNVYRIYGEQPGKTLLIMGGIQGDEPGGYLAADRYVEMTLQKGNLIVVPRANFYSILRNDRGVNGDMNRKFDGADKNDMDSEIIEKLKGLMAESDFLLNLHDGSGFYDEEWKSADRNPMKFGQSIIADCERFHSRKYNTDFDMAELARRVCARVNGLITNPEHHFNFNNHRTSETDSRHKEQRKSATYFAVMQQEIPAFGIETSKNVPSARDRVRYQTMVINAFMEEFGIVPENPRIVLPDPALKYIIVSVNGNTPIAVQQGKSLRVSRGDEITLVHIEANYERGLSANVEGFGSYNDMRRPLAIDRETKIIVKKDHIICGTIPVVFGDPAVAGSGKRRVCYLIAEVNGRKMALAPGEELNIRPDDRLRLVDLVVVPHAPAACQVNFKGFVGNRTNNDGEDRGYEINPARDLMRKFSVQGRGSMYPVEVKCDNKVLARFYVSLTK